MTNDNHIEMSIPTIHGMDEILKPSDRPVMGKQRLVRFMSIEGMGNFPIVWTSPYTVMSRIEEHGPEIPVVVCLVLISKGPPKPDAIGVNLRPEDLEKCPMAPVEW